MRLATTLNNPLNSLSSKTKIYMKLCAVWHRVFLILDMPINKRVGDIEAEIYFLTTEEGGRKTPAASGYRPQFYYDGHDWDAMQDYDVPMVYPGQTVIARLTFLSPQCHLEKLYVGKDFLIREGQKTVAKGKITKILNLLKSAEEAKIREA